MASIINSISFKNFFNYYGDYDTTRYEFEEGVNIVVADNGAGKSKFFNAFLWLFYDQILDSDDKKKKNVKDIAVKIISDKAKNETPIGDQVQSGIKIEYSTGRYKYQITKSLTATRLSEKVMDFESWQIIIDDIEVDKTDHVLPKYKPIYDADEKQKVINQLILPTLRQYSFFQGEEVDKMIDFNKKSSIEDAVRTLTNISKYEDIANIVKDIAIKAEKDLNKQTNATSEHNERLNKAIDVKKQLEIKLIHEEEKLTEFNTLYETAEYEKNELEQNFANAEKRKELDDKIFEKNNVLKQVKDNYDSFLDSINNRFFDGNFSWIALGFENSINEFKNNIKVFRQQRYEKRALQNVSENPNDYFTMLPVNSPDAVTLDQMIEDQICYVCNRDAKEGSEAYNYLLKLKNRPNIKSSKVDFVKNDLEDFFGDLQLKAAPFINKFDSISQSVLRTREKEQELKQRLDKLSSELRALKSQRKDILIAGTESEGVDNALTIINQYKGAIRRMEQASSRIERLQDTVKKLKADIYNTEKEISNLRPKNIPEGYTVNYEISKDLVDATQLAKERVFDKMVSLLEDHSNIHFQNLIKYNDIKGGVLRFQKTPSGGISLDYIDDLGNEVSGASEGFQRMKKFAVVMSIISANTSQYNYPLLADAPLSAFGKAFNKGFFEAIPDVFPQSIILVKDLYDKDSEDKLTDLGQQLIKNNVIKTFYINEVDEESPQIERTTKIERRK
ncbi:AAA family ATPase [Flavobacteriaceae bacterium Ap0902]|nr:AAA family ATPase [Flavobacteriaceae bacterium Ap0902]